MRRRLDKGDVLRTSVYPNPAAPRRRSPWRRSPRRRWVLSCSVVGAVVVAAAVLVVAHNSGTGAPARADVGAHHTHAAGGSTPAEHRPRSARAPAMVVGGTPTLVAVTTAGLVEVLDLSSGTAERTLASGATGDQVSVSSGGGRVYFEASTGCVYRIESVPLAGGPPTVVAEGSLPAVSPDGRYLAYVRQPYGDPACQGQTSSPGAYVLVVRTLATGAETTFPLAPRLATGGVPFPIDHLSWSADGRELAVSIAATGDNSGWAVTIVQPATATFYDTGAAVPVADDAAAGSYYREAVFLPDGDLFVNRVCCEGVAVHRVSSVLAEVDPRSGALVRQVAVGFVDRDHSSLTVDGTGRWLAYLSGDELFVSHDGARPDAVASGFVAVAL